jgi:hypothetical protein
MLERPVYRNESMTGADEERKGVGLKTRKPCIHSLKKDEYKALKIYN